MLNPAWLDGISIEALSPSTVINDCSMRTLSPGAPAVDAGPHHPESSASPT
jgi:hypothetical protein